MSSRFNFEKEIVAMNVMYQLPVAAYPTIHQEVAWQQQKFPVLQAYDAGDAYLIIEKRLKDFFGPNGILPKEVKEYEDLVDIIKDKPVTEDDLLDFLTGLADLLCDIQVYCASEMERFGLPNQLILSIIMESNKSKLDENGQPIYDSKGKFLKGPNYWKPEPRIRELIASLRAAAFKNQLPG